MDVNVDMLAALLSNETIEAPSATHEEMTTYLRRYVNNVGIDVRKSLGRILWLAGLQAHLIEDTKGTSINLDVISEYVPQLYEYLRHEVEKTIIK